MKQQQLISIIIRLIKLSKTKGSGFFCFSFNKRSPEENWVFLHTLFLENEEQIDKDNNYRTMLFMSKQVSLPEISSILQKMKIGKKLIYCYALFAWRPPIVKDNLLTTPSKRFFSDTSFCLVSYVDDQQKIHRVYKTFFFSMLVDKENWGTGTRRGGPEKLNFLQTGS